MAPAPASAFLPQTPRTDRHPGAIVAGAANATWPVHRAARYCAARIACAELTNFPGDVGHYVFVGDCTAAGRVAFPALRIDASGVDRDTVHAQTSDLAEAFFACHLQ